MNKTACWGFVVVVVVIRSYYLVFINKAAEVYDTLPVTIINIREVLQPHVFTSPPWHHPFLLSGRCLI
jgi:hypothetical protein